MSAVIEAGRSDGLLQVIQSAAANPEVDIDKMERLYAMYERIKSKEAEAAFNSAMSAAQGEMGRVSADATNPQTRSRYASYGHLDAALRPIYTRHGFALSFDTETAVAEVLRVKCRVTHSAGFSREHAIDMPADGKGAKGGDVMTKTHATGAAASYGMRYLLKLIFNVAIGETDDDGNGKPQAETISRETQLTPLLEAIAKAGMTAEKFCNGYGIGAVVDLPAAKFDRAMQLLADRAKKRGEAA